VAKFVKVLVFLLIVLQIFVYSPKKTTASNFFIEDFNTSLTYPKFWTISPNSGTVSFTENAGFITLASNSNSFPYVRSQNPFSLTNDFEIEVSFQYLTSSLDYGAGIAFSSTSYDSSQNVVEDRTVFGIWQDSGDNRYFRISTNTCPYNKPNCNNATTFYKTIYPDFSYHTIKYQYYDNTYLVYLDNELIFTSSKTTLIPNNIWFGNQQVVNPGEWANFKINYIKIDSVNKDTNSKLFFLPGMMGCWNKAIVTGGTSQNWNLFPIANLTTYKPILDKFNQADLEEGSDYYVFCYDWRQSVAYNEEKLFNYINENTNPDDQINLLGHSMGGIIARAYTQHHPAKINKLVTAGTPHKGVPQAYYAWEGGVILDNNPISKFIKELVLWLNKTSDPVKMNIIRDKIPSTQDLLPTYSFLTNTDNTEVKLVDKMIQQNDYFIPLNNSFGGDIQEKLTSIYGNITPGVKSTPDKTKIAPFHSPHANWVHYSLGMWEDGEPLHIYNEEKNEFDYSPSFILGEGDKTVTAYSTIFDSLPAGQKHEVITNHTGVISSTDSMYKIFSIFDIPFPTTSTSTIPINKILGLIMHSPANFSISYNDKGVGYSTDHMPQLPLSFYDEGAKTIIIGNPPESLQLSVLGESDISPHSNYEINILHLDEDSNFTGYNVADTINPDEYKNFTLNITQHNPFSNEENIPTITNSFLNKVKKIEQKIYQSQELKPHQKKKIVADLKIIFKKTSLYQKYWENKKYKKAVLNLSFIFRKLFHVRKLMIHYLPEAKFSLKINSEIYDLLSDLQLLYEDSYQKAVILPKSKYLEIKIRIAKKFLNSINHIIQKKINMGLSTNIHQALAFTKAQEELAKALHAHYQNSDIKALSYLKLVRLFLLEAL
jgi:hypothetical protein